MAVPAGRAAPVQARFKLTGHLMFINRGKGTAVVDGDQVTLKFDDGRVTSLRFADLSLGRLNPANGLWELKPKQGKKTIIQTTGSLFSVGPREEGQALNEAITAGLARANVPGT